MRSKLLAHTHKKKTTRTIDSAAGITERSRIVGVCIPRFRESLFASYLLFSSAAFHCFTLLSATFMCVRSPPHQLHRQLLRLFAPLMRFTTNDIFLPLLRILLSSFLSVSRFLQYQIR